MPSYGDLQIIFLPSWTVAYANLGREQIRNIWTQETWQNQKSTGHATIPTIRPKRCSLDPYIYLLFLDLLREADRQLTTQQSKILQVEFPGSCVQQI